MAYFTNLAKTLISSFNNAKLMVTKQLNLANKLMGMRAAHNQQSPTSRARRAQRLKGGDSFGRFTRYRCKQTEPRCGREALPRLRCDRATLKYRFNDPCCVEKCKDALPRFDELYYKPSDKLKRKYTRTWCEFPNIYIKPKGICCFEKIKYVQPERRRNFKPPKPLCPVMDASCMLMWMCRNRMNKRCAKITWSGCRKSREPPVCIQPRLQRDCHKKSAPYPSFSECRRPLPPLRRPIECNCLRLGAICRPH